MSFVERSFYELNPETNFSKSPHIEVMASRLEACRQGKTRRLIVNQPPRLSDTPSRGKHDGL
jgi:hypothetical protein